MRARYDLDDRKAAYRAALAVWYAYRKAALAANGDRSTGSQETLFDLPHFIFDAAG